MSQPLQTTFVKIRWQEGSITAGVNGATLSDVLSVCLDRLTVLVADRKTNSREFAHARTKVEEAVMWLQKQESKDGLANSDY